MSDLIRILLLFRPVWGWMASAAALAAVTVLASVALLATSGWFIAAMGIAGLAGTTINYFTPAAMIRAFAMARTVGRYGDRLIGHEATLRIVTRLRVWLFEKLVPLAPFGTAVFRSADLMTRLRSDVERLELVFLRLVSPAAVAVVTTLIAVTAIALWHPGLALVVFGLLFGAGVLVPLIAAWMAEAPGRRVAEASSELNASMADLIEGLAELEACGATEQMMARATAKAHAGVDAGHQLAGILGGTQAVAGISANLALMAALLLLIPSMRGAQVDGAGLVMLTLLAWAAFECVVQMPPAALSLGATRASARRVLAIVEAAPPVEEPRAPRPLPSDHTLAFSGVSLRYRGAVQPAIEGVDLVLEPGRKLGIVGASGSGKSSLISLALRLLEPSAGAIRLGGEDVRAFSSDDVRSVVSVLPQTVHIFTGTIADNLRLAQPDASLEQIEAACRAAQLHDFVRSLPRGYDTFVGAAGLNLSGGEVRRLAVARALLKDAPILLLDEPTEGLDEEIGRALLRDVGAACRDRSLLVISHRTAGLEILDELLVMQNGRIVERGPPRRILADKRAC